MRKGLKLQKFGAQHPKTTGKPNARQKGSVIIIFGVERSSTDG